jgi:hypothetical protein
MPYLGHCTILTKSIFCTDKRVKQLNEKCKWVNEKEHEFECDMDVVFGYQCISPSDYGLQQDAIEKKVMEIGMLKRDLEECQYSN